MDAAVAEHKDVRFLQMNVDDGANAKSTSAFNDKNGIKNSTTAFGEVPSVFAMRAFPHMALIGTDGKIVANYRYRAADGAKGDRVGPSDFGLLSAAA